MSTTGDFFAELGAARGSDALAIEGPKAAGQPADGLGVRMALYASGAMEDRREDLAAAREWAQSQGLTVVSSHEDDLISWLVWNREPLRDAVGVIAAGRAGGLLIPHATYELLTAADREWLGSALDEIGGRLVTAPRARADLPS